MQQFKEPFDPYLQNKVNKKYRGMYKNIVDERDDLSVYYCGL